MSVMDTKITDQASVDIERRSGVVGHYNVTEFDGGDRYLMTIRMADTQVQFHFDREGWATFRHLCAAMDPVKA